MSLSYTSVSMAGSQIEVDCHMTLRWFLITRRPLATSGWHFMRAGYSQNRPADGCYRYMRILDDPLERCQPLD